MHVDAMLCLQQPRSALHVFRQFQSQKHGCYQTQIFLFSCFKEFLLPLSSVSDFVQSLFHSLIQKTCQNFQHISQKKAFLCLNTYKFSFEDVSCGTASEEQLIVVMCMDSGSRGRTDTLASTRIMTCASYCYSVMLLLALIWGSLSVNLNYKTKNLRI